MSVSCPNQHSPSKVSIHGGHSAQFCAHAEDTLEEIIIAYRNSGFSWVGITEHMPPPENAFRYPDEIALHLDSQSLYRRFSSYISTCRSLQKQYRSQIQIAVGLETEFYSGAIPFIERLLLEFKPDYIVGSVHHVQDINFDFDPAHYRKAIRVSGDIDTLYENYFDIQYQMIAALQPAVVGHFDLIRIFDSDYRVRIEKPTIKNKILRNLQLISDLNLILDFNARALYKGADEPYVSRSILTEARKLEINVVPGDDSHGVSTVGYGIPECTTVLSALGFDTCWRLPVITYSA